MLCDEQGKVAAEDRSVCEGCSPGTQPKADRSACEPCTASTYSTFGIECLDCAAPSAVNSGKTSCTPPYQCTAGSSCPDGVDCSEQNDCEACAAGRASLGILPCVLCDEQGKVANVDQSVCVSCQPGSQPNALRASCEDCAGNTFSPYGIVCDDCLGGSAVNEGHTGCDDLSGPGVSISDPATAAEILGDSNVLPQTTMEVQADAATLVCFVGRGPAPCCRLEHF